MNIDEITDGIVIDHITAGRSMAIYRFLGLDKLDCQVAMIQNATSRKMGRKDIIKIDRLIDIDFDVIGCIDPGITIDVIKGGKLAEKRHVDLPETVTGVLVCKNPRCVTSSERGLPQVFRLTDRENKIYRCAYCDSRAK
ncbi:MAG: aspartate carbamoyltransferase regulatory subunit [Clostridia bacterium]|nr:aspartate carbamoyltransferase regulatory subunit [Clostridia bacterium]